MLLLLVQVLMPCWAANPTAVVLELYKQPYSAASSSSGSSSKGLQSAACFARLELPWAKLAQQQLGRPCLIKDLQVTASTTGAARNGSAPCNAAVEVVQWDVAGYLEHLQKLAAAAQLAAKAAAAQAAAAAANTSLGKFMYTLIVPFLLVCRACIIQEAAATTEAAAKRSRVCCTLLMCTPLHLKDAWQLF
jgi:hypothetical protein